MSVLETVKTTAVDEEPMDASPQPLVVLGLDAKSTAVSMVEWAAQEAIARGAELQIVTCSAVSCSAENCTARHGERLTDAVAAARRLHPLLSIDETAIGLETQNALVDKAGSADLLIVGESHLGTTTRRLLCSASGAALRRRSCPVIALRGQQRQPLRRITVGIDDSNAAATALDWAADEADRQGAELTIIHAWQRTGVSGYSLRSIEHGLGEAQRMLDDAVDRCETRMGRAVSSELVDGPPAAALAAASTSADLIAVGSRGSSGFKTMLFGSVARFVLENSDCPVAVIHPRVRAA
ncbi:MAG: universal stress protein [Ilumatobacteraceae bacterium]|nr:universal stress protein [Ilumatobacteraceae bacterium]